MRCSNCGNEVEGKGLFCPFCGTRISENAPGNTMPIYQAEVKGLLKSGKLIVYSDRTEFVMSNVQKKTFQYASLAAIKKGLDRINFIMEDGRTESCTLNQKILHEAFYIIEQACRPYFAERTKRLGAAGIRYSFLSSPSGLGSVLGSGMLNIMDDRSEYVTPSGKNDTVFYRDVKAVRISAMGALEYCLYDTTKKAFTIDKERKEEVLSFLQTALIPYIEERKARLLAEGIYFSFPNGRGVLNIYADRVEYRTDSGQQDAAAVRDIRTVRVSGGALELALTNGNSKNFIIDRDYQNEVMDFLNNAIAPYVEKRTKGFDIRFGINEKLEINEERGVFHVIRQGGKEISEEYGLQNIVKAEAVETKTGKNIVGSLMAVRGGDAAVRSAEERITNISIQLTVNTQDGTETIPVCINNFLLGIDRTGPEYERCEAERTKFFSYMEEHYPDCELAVPVPENGPAEEDAEQESETSAGAESKAASYAAAGSKQDNMSSAVGTVEKGQFGTLIDGISNFVERCGTPMTIAIQGDWESGSGSFMRMVYKGLEEIYPNNILWLPTWQFAQTEMGDQFPLQMADKLIELLGGSLNEEAKVRAKMLAQGVIGIASGIISRGSSDGKKLTDALFRDNQSNPLEQRVRLFAHLSERRAAAGKGKVIFFVDGVNRLTPAKASALLEALRYFFDCPGCIFMISVDQETVVRGREELGHSIYGDEKGEAYFNRLFKMAFRVPKASFDIQKYIVDNLGRVNISTDDEVEIRHYGALAGLSVGSEPKALERLFNSFLLLKSLAGEAAFSSKERRLALFALLCMQNRFPGVYHCLVQVKDQLTPQFLTSLAVGSGLEDQAALDEAEKQSFRTFAGELCASIDADEMKGISAEDCCAFAEALGISAITSLN